MSRRRGILLCVGLLAVAAGVAIGVLAMLPPRPGVTKANFDRIEVGMKSEQVQEIFGEGPSIRDSFGSGSTDEYWFHADRPGARITFCHNVVTAKIWQDSAETIPDKLRRWLHFAE